MYPKAAVPVGEMGTPRVMSHEMGTHGNRGVSNLMPSMVMFEGWVSQIHKIAMKFRLVILITPVFGDGMDDMDGMIGIVGEMLPWVGEGCSML